MRPLTPSTLAFVLLTPLEAVQPQASIRADSAAVVVTSGRGEVTLAPDRAVLRFRVASRAPTAAAASNANAMLVRRVLDSLNSFRQPGESLLVVGVTVRPYYDQQRTDVRGYETVATISVATRALDRVSRILDVGLAGGVTTVENLTWLSDREQAARRDALSRAFGEAQANAQALADAAGLRLGPLLKMSTEPEFGPFDAAARLQAATATAAYGIAQIAPTEIVVRSAVWVTWRLLPRAP